MKMVNKIEKTGNRKWDTLVIALCSAVIMLVCLCNLNVQDGVRIVGDEYAYWGMGAYFSGISWESMGHTLYYSYGYSFLLIPFFWLLKLGVSISTVYRMVIIMNACMLVISFLISLYVAGYFAERIPKLWRTASCLITALYINNIVQSGYAWDETLLYLMFWCTLLLFIRVVEKPSAGRIFWVAAAAVYCVMVHMRAVGVTICTAFLLGVFLLIGQKKRDWKKILWTVFLFAAGIVLFLVLKNCISENVYLNNDRISHNSLDGQTQKLKLFFSLTGLYDLFVSFCGKVFYQGTASFFMVPLGISYGVALICGRVWNCLKNKTLRIEKKEWTLAFIVLSVCAELAISAVFKVIQYYSNGQTTDRIDNIYYGRYAEFVMGPALLLGLLMLYNARCYIKHFLVSAGVVGIASCLVQKLFDAIIYYRDLPQYTGNQSAFSGIYYLMDGNYEDMAFRIFFYTFLIAVICFGTFLLLQNGRGKAVACVLVCVLTGSIWVSNGVDRVYEAATEKNWRDKSWKSISELVEKLDYEGSCYLVMDENRSIGCWLQWWLPTLEVNEITSEEYKVLYENGSLSEVLVFSSAAEYDLEAMLTDQLRYMYNSGEASLFVERGSELETKIEKLLPAAYSYSNPQWYEVDLEQAKTKLGILLPDDTLKYSGNGQAGYLTWETGAELEDGSYEFVIDMDVSGFVQDSIYVTVTNEESTWLDTCILTEKDVDRSGKAQVRVAMNAKNFEHPVIGVYVSGEPSVRVDSIRYRQTNARGILENDACFQSFGEKAKLLGDMPIYYVDSDSSSRKGFIDTAVLKEVFGAEAEYVQGDHVPYKNWDEGILIVENAEQFEIFSSLSEKFVLIEYADAYSLWVSNSESVMEILQHNGIAVLAPDEGGISLEYLGTSVKEQGTVYQVTLPDGQYCFKVSVDAEEEANGWFQIGEKSGRVSQKEQDFVVYLEDAENIEVSLLPENVGEWTGAVCTVTKLNDNRQTLKVFDRMSCYGGIWTDEEYFIESGSAQMASETFRLGARHYGILIDYRAENCRGTVEFYRNGILHHTMSLEEAVLTEEGEYCIEYEFQDYDAADWSVQMIMEDAEQVSVNRTIEILEYVSGK